MEVARGRRGKDDRKQNTLALLWLTVTGLCVTGMASDPAERRGAGLLG
jgi:hypothetical protein